MSKIRSDSLFAKLKTDENRDLLLSWLVEEGISYEEAAARCAEHFGFQPSEAALSTFFTRHRFEWKLEQAKLRADATKDKLPADFEAAKKRGLAQREFEMAYSELSVKELVALKRIEIAEARVALDSRKVAMLEKKLAEATEALGDESKTPAEREARMREIFGLA